MIVVVAPNYQRFRDWAKLNPDAEDVVPVYDAIGVLRLANHVHTDADQLVVMDEEVWHVPAEIRDVLLAQGWFDQG